MIRAEREREREINLDISSRTFPWNHKIWGKEKKMKQIKIEIGVTSSDSSQYNLAI